MKLRDYCLDIRYHLSMLSSMNIFDRRLENCDYAGCEHFYCYVKHGDIFNLQQYHFGCTGRDLYACYAIFQERAAVVSKLAEAEILYKKGFDRVDLLMLADLVDNEWIASHLRGQDRFVRGFWALDALRVL